MLNQIVLVGRLTRDIEVHKGENGKVATISIAIPRSFKNADGVYDTDFVDCVAFETIAENTSEYCKKGDIIGVKGRIQTREKELEDGTKSYEKQIIAEKVKILSSKKNKDEEPEQEKVEEQDEEMEM